MLKKFITPIIYAIFIIPILIGTIYILDYLERNFGFLFGLTGLIEIPLVALIYGGVLLFFANALINNGIEKPSNSFTSTHVRQSIAYYLGFASTASFFLFSNDYYGLFGAVVAIVLSISFFAIIINAIYLKIYSRKLKQKKHENQTNN